MTVVQIDQQQKQKGSPMLDRIDDPGLRDRAIAALQFVQEKYSALGTWAKVAKAIRGVSENQLHGFVGGSYPASPANIIVAIERARALEEERASTVFMPEFVETSIARRVRRAVKQTRARGQLGTLAGDSGIGKSTALNALCREDHSLIYVMCDPTLNLRVWPVLSLILKKLGSTKPGSSPYLCYQQLVEILADTHAQRRMLILDEAQQLGRPETLDTLRSLSEASGTPILFSGNSVLHEFGFLRGAQPSAFTQFTRRCAVTEYIRRDQITKADIVLLAGQRLDEDVLEETVDTLLDLARMPGALGSIHLTLQRSHEKARGSKITAAQVFAAAEEVSRQQKRGAM